MKMDENENTSSWTSLLQCKIKISNIHMIAFVRQASKLVRVT